MKLLERIVNGRLIRFLETSNVLNDNQYRFRNGTGTKRAIANLYEVIVIPQTAGHNCIMLCRDVSKAFNKVWQEGLQYKFLQQGLPELIEKLLYSLIVNSKITLKSRIL